eukprot:m51a1_g2139 hypothetical protein (284) ;mRNA; f:1733145-1734393
MESSWVEIPCDGPLSSGSTFNARARFSFKWLTEHSSDLSLSGSLVHGESQACVCECGMPVLSAAASRSCAVQTGGLIMTFEGLRLHYCPALASADQSGAVLRLWVSCGHACAAMADMALALPSKTLLRDVVQHDEWVATLHPPVIPLPAFSSAVSAEFTPVTPLLAQAVNTSATSTPATVTPSRTPVPHSDDDDRLLSVLVSHEHLTQILSRMSDVTLLDASTRQALALQPAIKRRRGRPLGKMGEEAKRLKNEHGVDQGCPAAAEVWMDDFGLSFSAGLQDL